MPKITIQHVIAFAVVVGFFIVANIIIIQSVRTEDHIIAFGFPMLVGALSSIGFFYIFMREETFPFATIIERSQKKAEKRWLKYLPKTGKIATVAMLGIVGGPLLAAFSAQFLLPKYKYRYHVLFAIGLLSGFLVVSAAKGIFAGGSAALVHFLAQ
jgi:hypothetical protein